MILLMFFSFVFAQTEVQIKPAVVKKANEKVQQSQMLAVNNWTPKQEALDISFPVEKFQLKNGMTVLLHQDNSVPMVSYHTWFRVGSRNEEIGKTGLAHFLEHLMFKGTEKYPNKEFDKILQSNGITNNAFTSRDYTGYYEILPSSKLELIMDIESDRLANLQIREPDFISELDVVKEERRMRVDNSPVGMMWEAMFRTVFRVHPYGWPVIGWMKDLDNMDIGSLRAFYANHYGPNNAVLVIAGDIDVEETRELVTKYYQEIPAIDIPEQEFPEEPAQSGQRNAELVKNVQSERVLMAFVVPKAGTDTSYALDLAANVLGEGTSSRLYRRLVHKERVASSVSAYNYTLSDHGVFIVQASVLPGKSIEDVKASIFGELWKLRNTAVSIEELKKSQNQVMTQYVNSLQTIDSKASLLATNEILFGDYTYLFKDLERYRGVTIEQIQSISEKVLNPHQRSVIMIKKKGGAQ